MKLYTQRKGAISKKTELDALVQVGMFVPVKHSVCKQIKITAQTGIEWISCLRFIVFSTMLQISKCFTINIHFFLMFGLVQASKQRIRLPANRTMWLKLAFTFRETSHINWIYKGKGNIARNFLWAHFLRITWQ